MCSSRKNNSLLFKNNNGQMRILRAHFAKLSVWFAFIQNQFEANDEIPSTARNLHLIYNVTNTHTKIFHALMRAMHAFEI